MCIFVSFDVSVHQISFYSFSTQQFQEHLLSLDVSMNGYYCKSQGDFDFKVNDIR